MAFFEYMAVDGGGRDQTGRLDAADLKSAAGALRRRGLFVAQLQPATAASEGAIQDGPPPTGVGPAGAENARDILRPLVAAVSRVRWITDRDRILLFQRVALMLRSGLTLLQALDEAIQTTSKPRMVDALLRIRTAIRAGKRFSQALADEKRLFSPLVVKLLETAEASGEMDEILDQLAKDLDQEAQLRATFLTSMMYPAIVMVVAFGTAAFLVVTVIPRFAKFFAVRHATLPWATQALLDASEFINRYGVWLAAIGCLAAAAVALAYSTSRGRLAIDRGLLAVPVVGRVLTAAAMAHLGRSLAILIRSGVTLLESLRIVSGLIGNRAISIVVERATGGILDGKSLGDTLRVWPIPTLAAQLVVVGERTGTLDHVLDEMGQFYQQQLQMTLKRMSVLIEPALILIIGIMVGFVYFAFFQSIIQLATAGR